MNQKECQAPGLTAPVIAESVNHIKLLSNAVSATVSAFSLDASTVGKRITRPTVAPSTMPCHKILLAAQKVPSYAE